MERTISVEDRIRRAEEIYNRRKKTNGIRVSTNNVNKNEKTKISLMNKMIRQIVVCIIIYIIFYIIKNGNYIFSENVLNKTKEFLSYDINFQSVQKAVTSFFNENQSFLKNFKIFNNEENKQENTDNANIMIQNEIQNTVGGIGGATENEISEESQNITTNGESSSKLEENNKESNKKDEVSKEAGEDKNKEETKKSQEEIDIEYIKENYEFSIPVKGTITSRYGNREATEVVSANHVGIDIGANEGTPIYSAMSGTVIVSSSEGEYGKHIDIQNGDVLTRYAHCSKLLVKEGDKVKKGDKIAEVGSTGNSTGPHLHFEIRRENRTINPEKIIDFK